LSRRAPIQEEIVSIHKTVVALTVAAAGMAVAPAAQAETAKTTLSVTIGVGALTISAPSSASLGSTTAAVGATAAAQIGEVTVTDTRGSLLGWSVTAVTDTDSMSTGGEDPDTILLTAVAPLLWETGTVSASGGSLLSGVSAGAGGFLNNATPIPVAVSTLGNGGGIYTYNPTVTLAVPPNTVAGTYSVVVTQTVS
jgi:hypothetical protein